MAFSWCQNEDFGNFEKNCLTANDDCQIIKKELIRNIENPLIEIKKKSDFIRRLIFSVKNEMTKVLDLNKHYCPI